MIFAQLEKCALHQIYSINNIRVEGFSLKGVLSIVVATLQLFSCGGGGEDDFVRVNSRQEQQSS